jgi:hypothetical protein
MAVFGKNAGSGGGFFWIIKGILGAWFPHAAQNTKGTLTSDTGWLNITDLDEDEITEVWVKEDAENDPAAIPGIQRAVFIKNENVEGYRFIGVYALTYVSKSGRTRVYTRISKDFPDAK